MTSPASNAPALVQVSSHTAAPCGTFQGSYQIINYSENSTVWVSNQPNAATGVGLPIQPQSAVTVAYATLYAALDSAATDPALLIIGGQVQDWNPSPVKVVNISGPVSVTGEVAIDGTVDVSGSVAISSGEVDATITGPVTIDSGNVNVVNTPGVFPLTSLVHIASNINLTPGTPFPIAGLSAYNSLLVSIELTIVTGTPTSNSYIEVDVSGFTTSSLLLYATKLFLQATSSASSSSLVTGDQTLTTIPLNGIDHVSFNVPALPAGVTSAIINLNLYGTNSELMATHRSVQQIVGPIMFSSGAANIPVTTAAQVTIPIPITNNPVSIYAFSSGTATGTPSTTLAIEDSISNRVQPFVQLAIPKSTNIQWQLPHSLNPMFLRIQETVAGATSNWQVMFTEDAFPQAA